MHQEQITLEISEEIYKSIEEIIEEERPEYEEISPLSDQTLSNIASNVADEVNKEISTEKYLEELMEEMGIEELNPQHDNALPDDPVLAPDDDQKDEEEVKTNFGQTRISYNIPPNRKARYVDRPIYRCQGGGEVVVAVVVDPMGQVLHADIESATTNEICIHEMALISAQNFLFNRDPSADKKVKGTITYIFVAQ